MADEDNSVNITRRGYHHGDLRSALLDAGLRLLAEKPVDAVSLREVARSVGVSATAVYRHFPDKAALLAAIGREGLDRLAAAQRDASAAAGGGAAGFAATGRAYVRFALAHPALFRLIFASPEARALQNADADALAMLRANAAEAVAEAEDGAAARVRALGSWALVHGLALLMLDGLVPADEGLIDAVIGDLGTQRSGGAC